MHDLMWLLPVLAVVPAAIASKKGHSALLFWLYGLVILPLALVHALMASPAGGDRTCPFCAETIMRAAKVCPHCRHDLAAPEAKPLSNYERAGRGLA